MQKERITQPEIKLVGLTARTNNKNEMVPGTAKIAPLANLYWQQNMASQIQNRKNPGVTIAVYTDYASDEHGDYTYFIGEVVTDHANQSNQSQTLSIPAGTFQKFTTEPGKMPMVVIQAWQNIWQMKQQELGGQRNYLADYEVYDERALDPNHMVVDIYIGIK